MLHKFAFVVCQKWTSQRDNFLFKKPPQDNFDDLIKFVKLKNIWSIEAFTSCYIRKKARAIISWARINKLMDFYERILMSTIQFADAIALERDTLSWSELDEG